MEDDAEILDMHYTELIQQSCNVPYQFLYGYCQDLERQLGIPVALTTNRPHLYLSEKETFTYPIAHCESETRRPYWLVSAGTKQDFTLKQWPLEYYQSVVDHFRDRLTFVQVGSTVDDHPPLDGVTNLVGKTTLRELIHLAYHAHGGLGPITLLQHLCAAFEKPYLALLGGREPVGWVQYPLQTTFHTIGALDCCKTRACWRSRVVPLGDGNQNDKSLCDAPVQNLLRPVGKCMTLIKPGDVIGAIERVHFGNANYSSEAKEPPTDKQVKPRRQSKPVSRDLDLVAHSAWGFDTSIVPAPAERDWMGSAKDGFAYHCLPMCIANQSGWFILAPYDATAEWNGGSGAEDIRIQVNTEVTNCCMRSSIGHGILTWLIPYVFRTSPGWNLLCRGPANLVRDGIYPLEGLVETDWAVASFSMNWKFTRPGCVSFAAGEPVAMIVPQRRFDLEAFQPRYAELRDNPALAIGYEQWAHSRTDFIAARAKGEAEATARRFQKHYFHGCTTVGGTFFHDHQKARDLASFTNAKKALEILPPRPLATSTTSSPNPTAGLLAPNAASLSAKPVLHRSFAHTSPYHGCWLEHYYRRGGVDLFRNKIVTEHQFLEVLGRADNHPSLMIMGNFIRDRHSIRSICRQLSIDCISSEDGFFPHYSTLHVDPLGFSWESSLPRMVFRSISPKVRRKAQTNRKRWMRFARQELPGGVCKPYVLWPLQLIKDQVNRWDLNANDWLALLAHFRECLPPEFQLVVKPHPRAMKELDGVASHLFNTLILEEDCHLQSLLEGASAVAGANSTVLLEARLMFHKPTYCYARGWHTNHTEIFWPLQLNHPPRALPHVDCLYRPKSMRDEWHDDYADWFLYQLLIRQLGLQEATNFELLYKFVGCRTFRAFELDGEDIFK